MLFTNQPLFYRAKHYDDVHNFTNCSHLIRSSHM